MAMTEAANDSLYRNSGFGVRDSNAISRIADLGPLSVIVYSWTVDHAVGLLFAMEELAW